jgi:hypothetical protein
VVQVPLSPPERKDRIMSQTKSNDFRVLTNTNTFALTDMWKGKKNPTIHIVEIPHEDENLDAWGINGPIVKVLCGRACFHWPVDESCTTIIDGRPMLLNTLNKQMGDTHIINQLNLETYFEKLCSIIAGLKQVHICRNCLRVLISRLRLLKTAEKGSIDRRPVIPETLVVESLSNEGDNQPKVYGVVLLERSLLPPDGRLPDKSEDLVHFLERSLLFEKLNVYEHGLLIVAKTPEEAVTQFVERSSIIDTYDYFLDKRVVILEISIFSFVAALEKETKYNVYLIKK